MIDKLHLGQHISTQFNEELEDLRHQVLAMGGLVEQQIANGVKSLVDVDTSLAEEVIAGDLKVNQAEVTVDEECNRILARRQPAATDLRLIVAIIKTITDLERIGDEAEKIAKMALRSAEDDRPGSGFSELVSLAGHVREMVRNSLDAFARLDTKAAIAVAKADKQVDREYEAITRQSITHMMEDPRTIRRVLDTLWSARALERIGDHAKNISEYVVYMVEGKDIRHTSLDSVEAALKKKHGEDG